MPGFKRFDMIVTLAPQMNVLEAVRLMSSVPVGAAPVLEGKDIVGLFSERDLMVRVVAEQLDPETLTIEEVMTTSPITASFDDPKEVAMKIMLDKKCRNLPILGDDGHILGVLTMQDLMEEVLD